MHKLFVVKNLLLYLIHVNSLPSNIVAHFLLHICTSVIVQMYIMVTIVSPNRVENAQMDSCFHLYLSASIHKPTVLSNP